MLFNPRYSFNVVFGARFLGLVVFGLCLSSWSKTRLFRVIILTVSRRRMSINYPSPRISRSTTSIWAKYISFLNYVLSKFFKGVALVTTGTFGVRGRGCPMSNIFPVFAGMFPCLKSRIWLGIRFFITFNCFLDYFRLRVVWSTRVRGGGPGAKRGEGIQRRSLPGGLGLTIPDGHLPGRNLGIAGRRRCLGRSWRGRHSRPIYLTR